MPKKRKPTTDAIEILQRRYYEGRPDRLKALEEEDCEPFRVIGHRVRHPPLTFSVESLNDIGRDSTQLYRLATDAIIYRTRFDLAPVNLS